MSSTRPPVLVFAAGNPSRGDDAVGPLLADRLAAAALPGVEVLTDFQWQVEHALDLEGRQLAIFVDASCDASQPFTVQHVVPDARLLHTSHAFTPAHVLEAFRRVTGQPPPPAVLLGVRATSFDLGAAPSAAARHDAELAWSELLALIRSSGRCAPGQC
jgi:hydrogenase maturation protease